MEEWDMAGFKPCEKLEAGGNGPHVVQVGSIREFLTGESLEQTEQEPVEGLQQAWEAQWHAFLKVIQTPHSEWKDQQLPQVGQDKNMRESQASLDEVASASQWSQEAETLNLPGLSGENQDGLKPSVNMEGKVVRNKGVSLETQRQRFRQFCYLEARGPREASMKLHELCCQWLRPEQSTKQQMLEILILEQFLTILPQDMQSWVKKGDPVTCSQAVDLAEDFLLRLQDSKGEEEKIPGPLEEVTVHSPISEQDSLDTMKMHYPVETENDSPVETESDGETSFLDPDTDGHKWKNKIFQPEQVDVSGRSPKRPQELSFPSLVVDEMFESSQNMARRSTQRSQPCKLCFVTKNMTSSERNQEKYPEKMALQALLCDQDSHQSSFPEKIDKCQIETTGTEQENPKSKGSSHLKTWDMLWKENECLYCGKVFRNTSYLIVHLRTQEGCKQLFSHLVGHKNVPHGEEKHVCTECGKGFFYNSMLRRHRRMHASKRTYRCSQCGKCFSQRCVLWIHKKSHAEEKQSTCSDHAYSFCDTNPPRTHHRVPTREKTFECSECGKRFAYGGNLAKHEKLHIGEKSLQCSVANICATNNPLPCIRQGVQKTLQGENHTLVLNVAGISSYMSEATQERNFIGVRGVAKAYVKDSYLSRAREPTQEKDSPSAPSVGNSLVTQLTLYDIRSLSTTGENPLLCTRVGNGSLKALTF